MSEPQASQTDAGADRLRATYQDVRRRIAAACARAGRDPADVRIVAVSKTVSVERLRAALSAGITVFGENRVQEAEPKVAALPGARWEMVGHLQSNKAARAVELFDVIHSVDAVALAERLGRLALVQRSDRMPIYLQVNVDRDPAKAGFDPDELLARSAELAAIEGLEIRGLMTVGRLVDRAAEARPTFSRLRELSERLHQHDERVGTGLSMGMSDDFEVAVEEGATVVRLGRVLFGERPTT